MFEIGAIVVFKYTGVEAEIVEDHMDGSYTVWIPEDDDDSIAFLDDIILKKDFKQIEVSSQQKELKKPPKAPSTESLFFSKSELEERKRRALQPKHKKMATPSTSTPQDEVPFFEVMPIIETAPTQTGCYLAFHATSPNNYTIYLVNDTNASFSFEFKLYLKQALSFGFNKLIPANTFFPIGEFLHEQFNDSAQLEFKCPKINFKKTIKLKYRKFINTTQQIPLMGINTYGYLLFKDVAASVGQSSEDIRSYTQDRQTDKASITAPLQKLYPSFDLMDVAAFEPELDLHAEKLVNDTSEFTSGELYQIQLDVLDNFINKAIEMGLKEVYIIHGIGRGRLRDGVDHYLRFHGDVKSYKNEFHEKYWFWCNLCTVQEIVPLNNILFNNFSCPYMVLNLCRIPL